MKPSLDRATLRRFEQLDPEPIRRLARFLGMRETETASPRSVRKWLEWRFRQDRIRGYRDR